MNRKIIVFVTLAVFACACLCIAGIGAAMIGKQPGVKPFISIPDAVATHERATPRPSPTRTPRPPRPTSTPRYALALLAMRGHRSEGGNYFIVEGQVKNISGQSLEDILAVATVYDSSKTFITYDDALIDFEVLLPGQISPFSVMVDYNPAIEYFDVEFTELFGSTIPTRDDRTETSPDDAFVQCAEEVMGIIDNIAPTLRSKSISH